MSYKEGDYIQLKDESEIDFDFSIGDLRNGTRPLGIYKIIRANTGDVLYKISIRSIDKGWWTSDDFKRKVSKEENPEYFL